MYQILLDAGYPESVAKQQTNILNTEGVKRELKPITDQLIEKRQEAIDRLSGKIDEASYRDLNDGIDKFTKNIQLLGGKPTEIIDDYAEYDDDELRRIAESKGRVGKEGVSEETS